MVNESARDTVVEELTAAVLALSRSLRSLSQREVVKVEGVRRADVPLLRHLAERGPMRPGVLAELLGVGPSVVSRQLTTLVSDGLVTRRTDPVDARADLIDITDHGRARMAALWSSFLRFVETRVEEWDEQPLATLAQLLNELNQALNPCQPGTDLESAS